jgi:hypothetical protein
MDAFGEPCAQGGLADQEQSEGGRAVEVEIAEQTQLVEAVVREPVRFVEDEDLRALGARELVEDGLGGLGGGAARSHAVVGGELPDEAEGAAGAQGRVHQSDLALVERVGEDAEESGLAEPGLRREQGGRARVDREGEPDQGLGEAAVPQECGLGHGPSKGM